MCKSRLFPLTYIQSVLVTMYFTHFLEEASRRWEQAGMPWQYTPLCFPAEHKGYLSLQAPSDSLLLDVNFMTFPENKILKKSSFPSGPDCNLNPPPGEIDFTQVLPCSLNDTVSLKISPLLAMDCCWALFPVRTHSTRRWDGGKERDEGKCESEGTEPLQTWSYQKAQSRGCGTHQMRLRLPLIMHALTPTVPLAHPNKHTHKRIVLVWQSWKLATHTNTKRCVLAQSSQLLWSALINLFTDHEVCRGLI